MARSSDEPASRSRSHSTDVANVTTANSSSYVQAGKTRLATVAAVASQDVDWNVATCRRIFAVLNSRCSKPFQSHIRIMSYAWVSSVVVLGIHNCSSLPPAASGQKSGLKCQYNHAGWPGEEFRQVTTSPLFALARRCQKPLGALQHAADDVARTRRQGSQSRQILDWCSRSARSLGVDHDQTRKDVSPFEDWSLGGKRQWGFCRSFVLLRRLRVCLP